MPEKFEVVISGLSGRFPEAEDVVTFKKMLYNKESPITLDNRQWPTTYKYKFGEEVPNATGKYKNIYRFDARVFAMNHMLAQCTDVINRQILEPSFEAVLDAGINPFTLMGANVGCYMASGTNDTDYMKFANHNSFIGKLAFNLMGNSKTMQSNRVSFALNLTGPSVSFHSCVLGGLEAVSAAYDAIAEGHIEAAIVGCCSSMLDPKISVSYMRMGCLSMDSNCRAFSKDANGYGRSEATVCLYLQRAEDAKRNYATILFSECLYFGSNPFTLIEFDEETIEKTLQEIYSKHKDVDPSEISFVEMDACGVQRLEKVECKAITNIFCGKRETPLLVGSVKSSVGHTEASAGFVSLVKALLALDSGYIAPNMNFSEPNPLIESLMDNRLKVVTETTELPGPIVAVNSIGISGLVGHIVLKQNPKTKTHNDTNDKLPRLILLCGRAEKDLKDVVEKIEKMPLNTNMVALTNNVFKTVISHHVYRAYSILPAVPKPINAIEVVGGENRPIWFLFSGMGSQWNGMGKGLLDIPVFANAIDRCDKVLKPRGFDIYDILTSDDPAMFDDIVNAFVGITAVQVALVEVLNAIGIKPDNIIGHSVGENGCGYADGCLTLEQSVLASYARGVASKEVKMVKGMMAAIGKGYSEINHSLPEGIEVACHNSKDNCTLTGPAELVDEFVKELQAQNVFAKQVNVANIAYHSKHIAPAGSLLLKRLKDEIPEPKERSSKWISTSVPEEDWDKPLAKYCSAEYLTNNLLSAVLFEEGCKHIPDNAIVIEIAPHGLLQAILKKSFKPSVTNIPLTRRSQNPNAVNFLLSAIGNLFIAGCQPDVNNLYPKIEYPVPRGTPTIANLATWEHEDEYGDFRPCKDIPLSQELIKIQLSKGSEWRYLIKHRFKGRNIIPPSVYMYLTWHMLSVLKSKKFGTFNVVFQDIKIHKNLSITIDKYRAITILIQTGSGSFEVLLQSEKDPDKYKVLMTGIIEIPYEKTNIIINQQEIPRLNVQVTQKEFYKDLENIGYQLEDEFVNVEEISYDETDCFGKITWNNDWVTFLDSLMKIRMFLESNSKKDTLFPHRFRRLFINTSRFNALAPGDEVIVQWNNITKQMRCNGLELSDFESSPSTLDFLEFDEIEAELQQMRFVPHAEPDLENSDKFLSLCVQITVERLSANYQYSNITLSIVDTLATVGPKIKKIIKKFDYKPKVAYQSLKDVISKPFSEDYYFLTANSFENADQLCEQIKNQLNNVFLLITQPLDESLSWKNEKYFVEITRGTFNNTGMFFYKKLAEPREYPLPVIAADNIWMAKHISELETKKHEPIVVLRNTIETVDLRLILSRQKPYPNTRFLYILDDDAPEFAIDSPSYQNQIAQDLPVLIYKAGQWGTYRNLTCDADVEENSDLVISQDLQLQNVDIKYLNYDYQKISINGFNGKMEYEYGVEFSGLSDSGKRIMGLSCYNPLEALLKPDPLLTWNVPNSWSLESAATVPLYYAQAYYCIGVCSFRQEDCAVFVNSDLALAEACIAVALSLNRGYEVYVTVANEAEAEILKKKFPNLEDENIISRIDAKYDLELKLRTKGKDTRIVINGISGDYTSDCLGCLEMLGQYFDIVDDCYPENAKIGLLAFLNSASFNKISNKIGWMVQLPQETKQKIYDFIEGGIRNGTVQPLSRVVVNSNNNKSTDTLKNGSTEDKKKIFKCLDKYDTVKEVSKTKMKFDDTQSYLIVGGGKKNNLWFELLEWLISRGAKKFIVTLDNFTLGTKTSHQINRLLIQKKTTIILTSLKKIESVEEASNLIREANNLAPLEAVFIVALDPASPTAHNIDMASRTFIPVHFVCLSSGGLKECEERKRIGLPSVLIHSQKPIEKLTTLLPRIESILTQSAMPGSPTLYDLVDKSNKKEQTSISVCLSNYLPNDLQGLENIGYHATDSIEFIEVATLSKPYAECKGIFPVFIIPATDANQLKSMLRNIFYPAFCTTFTERCDSLSDIASKLSKDIQQIQPHGPITVIGETWNGPIAIEIGSRLQSFNRHVEVFLIEGNPATWQKHLNSIGKVDTPQFENNLLKQILHFEPIINKGSESQKLLETWEEHQNEYMNILQCTDEMKSNMVKTLNGIRNRLLITAKYSPQGEILKHITLFKHRPFESSLDMYCLSEDNHLFEEEKYVEFMKRKEMSDVINQTALFKWWK